MFPKINPSVEARSDSASSNVATSSYSPEFPQQIRTIRPVSADLLSLEVGGPGTMSLPTMVTEGRDRALGLPSTRPRSVNISDVENQDHLRMLWGMSEKDHADLESYIKESLSENTTADPVVPPQLKIKCPSKMEQSFATDSKRMPPPLVVPVKRTAKSTITETMLRTEGDQNIMMVASGPILTLPSGGEKIGELITTGSLSNLARGEERALAERQLELRTGQTVSPVSMSMSEWAKQMNIPITEILTKEVLAHLNEIPTDDRAQLYKELNALGIRSIIRGSEAGRKLESALAASQTSIPSQTRDRAEVKSWFPKSTTSTKPTP